VPHETPGDAAEKADAMRGMRSLIFGPTTLRPRPQAPDSPSPAGPARRRVEPVPHAPALAVHGIDTLHGGPGHIRPSLRQDPGARNAPRPTTQTGPWSLGTAHGLQRWSVPSMNRSRMSAPTVSVIVPVLNEEDNIALLVDAVRGALVGTFPWELIVVDDHSSDRTAELVRTIARGDPRVRLIRLARWYGQSTAMQAGFDHARGDVVVTMDGDLQNDPADIPLLVAELEKGFDLVTGYRQNRQDRMLSRKVPSWIANRIIRGVTGVSVRDNGCSLKAYRKELLARIRLYSDMHRFIPTLAVGMAGARISEVPVRHHARRHGQSKYNISRTAKVLADLLTIKMIRSFRLNPLRLFGGAGFACGAVSTAFALAAIQVDMNSAQPGLVVFGACAAACFALAAFLLLVGLIGEVAVRRDPIAAAGAPHLATEITVD